MLVCSSVSFHSFAHKVEKLVLCALGPSVRYAVVYELVDPCQRALGEVQAHPVKAGLQSHQLILRDSHAKGFSTSWTSKASTPPFP